MKSLLKTIDDHGKVYQALAFICPGCKEMVGGTGLHMLAINNYVKKPSWEFDGNLEKPTLNPSILTRYTDNMVCHSFLREGVFEFLSDCTHSLAGQKVEMPDLPDWFVEESE